MARWWRLEAIGGTVRWRAVVAGAVAVAVAQLVARLDRARCEVDRLAHQTGRLCEASEEVERLRRSLVGAVSHDLRSPLATIKVATSALLAGGLHLGQVDATELLMVVDEQADRLDRLVANLLDMTRIQSGALELRRQPTAVAGIVADALAAVGPGATGGRVEWQAMPGLPDVDVDPVLIGQVLVNLVDNATRYAPQGTPIEVSAVARGPGRVEVAVADQGPGVALQERCSIFDMVNRGEAGGRGGLGLAIARSFVEVHGERIWVESGHGHLGARFVFTLSAASPGVSPGGASRLVGRPHPVLNGEG